MSANDEKQRKIMTEQQKAKEKEANYYGQNNVEFEIEYGDAITHSHDNEYLIKLMEEAEDDR